MSEIEDRPPLVERLALDFLEEWSIPRDERWLHAYDQVRAELHNNASSVGRQAINFSAHEYRGGYYEIHWASPQGSRGEVGGWYVHKIH